MNNEGTQSVIEESKKILKNDAKTFKTFIKDVKEYLTTKNSNELKDLVIRLVLIAITIIVLYVPYQFILEIIEDLIRTASINYSESFLTRYYSIGRIIYSVLALVLFYIICKDRFYKLVKNQETNNNKGN